jgi:hypothetical protein
MERFNNNEARLKAERRVEELLKFYSLLLIYCVVNAEIFDSVLNYQDYFVSLQKIVSNDSYNRNSMSALPQ